MSAGPVGGQPLGDGYRCRARSGPLARADRLMSCGAPSMCIMCLRPRRPTYRLAGLADASTRGSRSRGRLNGSAGVIALAANLLVVVVGTLVLHAVRAPEPPDATRAGDYEVDADAPGVKPLP